MGARDRNPPRRNAHRSLIERQATDGEAALSARSSRRRMRRVAKATKEALAHALRLDLDERRVEALDSGANDFTSSTHRNLDETRHLDTGLRADRNMPIHIVRLGSSRGKGEGVRIGTVRRPPRGVPKSEFASRDFYDIWLPNLAPSEELLKAGLAVDDDRGWKAFARRYRMEMARPEAGRVLDLLAALSHTTDFAVGCYCENETRCHRSIMRELLTGRGAAIAS